MEVSRPCWREGARAVLLPRRLYRRLHQAGRGLSRRAGEAGGTQRRTRRVSGDEVATHKLFKETYGLKHTLLSDSQGELAKLVGIPVSAGGRVGPTTPDRKPITDTDGKRIAFERPVTIARWTLIVDKDGKIASLRNIVDPVTDSEEVRKIVEALPR